MATMTGTVGGADLARADASHAAEAPERFALEALARDKRESLDLAVKARWVALAVIAVMLPFINPDLDVVYYEGLLVGFAAIGWAQRRVGRVGRSQGELVLMFCDIALLTFTFVVPNPISAEHWPQPVLYRFGNFLYFFVLLGGAALAYSWRTVVAMGVWTSAMWLAAIAAAALIATGRPELTDAVAAALPGEQDLARMLDPNSIRLNLRIQEVVVFLIVAGMLALAARRSNRLLIDHAALERERTNLARYFSPNVVEALSHNDEPLKQVRTHDIAVLFVDIVGFTAFAADRTPEEVIATLRAFHARMEREVFRHGGTLDKFLGDGLMATFGTPLPGETDAGDALRCARAMAASVEAWNAERSATGQAAIKASFGLHFGPAVLGDIGANRLEFATLGNTVNVASRLEALTRPLGVTILASRTIVDRARGEPSDRSLDLGGMRTIEAQEIRGLDRPIAVCAFV